MRPTSLRWRRIISTAWRGWHHIWRLRLIVVIASIIRIYRRGLIVVHSVRLGLMPLATSMS
jgi:hypothetical protein